MADATNITTANAPAAEKPQASKKTAERKILQPTVEKRKTIALDANLTRDEKAMKVDTAKKTVSCTFTVKRSKDDTVQHVVETVFDYSMCSEEEILQLATAQCRISAQALLRKMPEAQMTNPNTFRKIDVKSIIIDTDRSPIDPDTRAIRSLAAATGMTLEEAEKVVIDAKKRKAA